MSFVAVFTTLMTGFVLLAPLAMVALLVRGPAPIRRRTALTAAPDRSTVDAALSGAPELQLGRAA